MISTWAASAAVPKFALMANSVIVAAHHSHGDNEGAVIIFLLALGPAAGIGFYSMMFMRYRNTNQRHRFERETASQISNVTGDDRLVGQVRQVHNSTINGNNLNEPLRRAPRSQITTHD